MTGEGNITEDDPRSQRVARVLAKPFELDELEDLVNYFVA
jgi:hypothetical protein